MSINWSAVLTKEELAAQEYDRLKKIVEKQRKNQYADISDPLFFGFQRGDNTEQEWLDAVEAIKLANPYPEQ